MSVVYRLLRAAGLAHASTEPTVAAGSNLHDRPDIGGGGGERTAANRDLKELQHRIIKCIAADRDAVFTLLSNVPKNHIFTRAEQALMNVELRWIVRPGGGAAVQERPLSYLNHDEKVFWAHDGPLKEWRFIDPTQEPAIGAGLRGKGFGSSIMVALFMSVLGIFFWEVTRYGGAKNGGALGLVGRRRQGCCSRLHSIAVPRQASGTAPAFGAT